MTIHTHHPLQADLPSSHPTASFWLSQLSEVLRGHRTTEHLPAAADVVVIGSGITAAFAARQLKHGWARDKRVVMLEAREACSGATGRNGGHCQPNMISPEPHLSEFELRNFGHVRDLIGEHSIPCDFRLLTGVNGLYDSVTVSTAHDREVLLRTHFPELAPAIEVLDRDPASARWAGLGLPTALAAELQPYAATLSPYKLVAWILEELVRRSSEDGSAEDGSAEDGLRLFNLQTNTAAWHLEQRPRGQGWIVHTHRGQISTPLVLVATNGYASRLLPEFTRLIVPTQGQVVALAPDRPVVLAHSYGFWGGVRPNRDDYLIQAADERGVGSGALIYGGGRQFATNRGLGISADDQVDQRVGRYLRSSIAAGPRAPADDLDGDQAARGKMRVVAEWTGIMGYSCDGRPWVGPVPEALGGGDGLWVCAGYTGHGMPNAPLSAVAVAQMMGGCRPYEVDLPAEFYVGEERVRSAVGGPA